MVEVYNSFLMPERLLYFKYVLLSCVWFCHCNLCDALLELSLFVRDE